MGRRADWGGVGVAAALCTAFGGAGCGAEVTFFAPEPSDSSVAGNMGSGGAGGAAPLCEPSAGPWREEVVADGAYQVTNAVRDSTGRLHVVADAGDLLLISGGEGDWVVDDIGFSQQWSFALALGPDDSLHLAASAYHWMYETAYWSNRGGAWASWLVATDGGAASLAVHADGTPHLAYLTWPDPTYRVVVDPAMPTTFELDAMPAGDVSPVMTFDEAGRLWLAYIAAPAGGPELRVVSAAPDGTLTTHVREPHAHAAYAKGLSLDASGQLHVVYVGEYNQIYHGELTPPLGDASAAWSSVLLNDALDFSTAGHAPVMALDADGHPHVAVTRGADEAPLLLRRDSMGWHAEPILGPDRIASALVVDEVGAAHVFSLEIGKDTPQRVFYSTNRADCD